MDYTSKIKAYLEEEKRVIDDLNIDNVNVVMNIFENARLQGQRIFICGNGGSASTAAHFTADFNKGVSEKLDKRYDVECLSDNVPTMMAIANDISYEEIFRELLKNKLHEGDVVVGISGSGNSENVVNAISYAKEHGAKTVVFVGYDGGKLMSIADHYIHINVNNMQITEDIHMMLDHLMMYTLTHRE